MDRREDIDEPHLAATIDRLVADGELTAEDAERLRLGLPDMVRQSGYILRHLGAHLAIGAIFAFDVIPLPLGSLSRGGWVIANRVYEEIRRNPDRARIHSLVVLGAALVPFVGYFAYLIPLRSRNAEAARLYANHISYRRWGKSLHAALAGKPRWMQRLVRWAIS
jgi:hypothetical protein